MADARGGPEPPEPETGGGAPGVRADAGDGGVEPGGAGGRENRRDPARAARWGIWRRGSAVAAVTVVVTLLVGFPSLVPGSPGNLGSLWETLLPWTGLLVPVVAVAALLRRSASAALAGALALTVWWGVCGHVLVGTAADTEPNLTVVTHNVDAANPDPEATARGVLAAEPDLVALEEVTWEAREVYEAVLGEELGHTAGLGTVGLWSRHPISEVRPVDIDMGWPRALRARVDGPDGEFAVYAVHLASVRVDRTGFAVEQRNRTIAALGAAVAEEPLERIVLLGDLNGTVDDRGLSPLTSQLSSVHGEAGGGFGFSWPAGFPMARIDHVLTRGVTATEAWSLPAIGSDHVPVAARLRV